VESDIEVDDRKLPWREGEKRKWVADCSSKMREKGRELFWGYREEGESSDRKGARKKKERKIRKDVKPLKKAKQEGG